MPPTRCFGCGSGRNPLGRSALSANVVRRHVRKHIPRDTLRKFGGRSHRNGLAPRHLDRGIRSHGQIVPLFQERLLSGHDLALFGLVLGHLGLERFLTQEHGQ